MRGPARDAVVCLAGGRHAVPGPAPAVQVTEEKQLGSGPGLPASNVGQVRPSSPEPRTPLSFWKGLGPDLL